MGNFKTVRMAEDIKREISGLLREIKDPRVADQLVTIIRCDVSSDLSYCKIYVSSLNGEQATKQAVKGFESASGFLKRHISNALHLKRCPELKFIEDKSGEHSTQINKILKELKENEKTENKDEEKD